MKVNKNQALYRNLPGAWISYSNSRKSEYKFACKIDAWNIKIVSGINDEMIRNDIKRKVKSFIMAGGTVKDDFSDSTIESSLRFVEPVMNENIPDIFCHIEPKVFYCQNCNKVEYRSKANESPMCNCGKKGTNSKRMVQLQMVYACECGWAEGVSPNTRDKLIYKGQNKDSTYNFFTQNGKKVEMIKKCPVCNKFLYPKNATDTKLFYSQSGNMVNLYNKNYENIIKNYGNDGELILLAKWFNILSNQDFFQIIDKPEKYFDNMKEMKPNSEQIKVAEKIGITIEQYMSTIAEVREEELSNGKTKCEIEKIIEINALSPWLKLIIKDLLEYDILKFPKESISLKSAIKKNILVGSLIEDKDINNMLDKMCISDIQVSESVQIVNYAFGYTRTKNCPEVTNSTNGLRLHGFEQNNVFTTILDTEGILVEFNLIKIYKWLIANEIIEDNLDFNSEIEYKSWFIENLKLDAINHFSPISNDKTNIVTKIVYSLLHTMSHMLILSAGRHSGLNKDSLSELIFPTTGSIFIYPTTVEGITLGSISGMFETDLRTFLGDALYENEICTFDPNCSRTQNGACIACAYISDVSCAHFNKDLSRSFLFGGTININGDKLVIRKGFWK